MTAVVLSHRLLPEDRSLLEAAGLTETATARVRLSRWPDPDLASATEATLCFVRDEAARVAALHAGAVSALVDPTPAVLGACAAAVDATVARLSGRPALPSWLDDRDLMARLVDATPNPVLAVDRQGRVVVFNAAAARMLGYDADWALQHLHITDVYVEPADARRVMEAIQGAPGETVQELELRLRARSGEQIPVRLSAAGIRGAGGRVLGTVGTFEDRRPELALRHRLEQTTDQLIASERRAASVELDSTTEELNQPLTSLMGTLEMLEGRRDVPGDVAERLQRAYLQAERMVEITRRLAHPGRGAAPEYIGVASRFSLRPTPDDP